MMKNRKLLLASMLAGIAFTSAEAFASGSFGGRGGSGLQDPYNYGKIVFHKKVNCSACSMAIGNLNETNATKLIKQLKGGNSGDLTKRESQAVVFYLEKRFKS